MADLTPLYNMALSGSRRLAEARTLEEARQYGKRVGAKIDAVNNQFMNTLASMVVDSPSKPGELVAYGPSAWENLNDQYYKWKRRTYSGSRGFYFLDGMLEQAISSSDVNQLFGRSAQDRPIRSYSAFPAGPTGVQTTVVYGGKTATVQLKAPKGAYIEKVNPVTKAVKPHSVGGKFISADLRFFIRDNPSVSHSPALVVKDHFITIYPFGQGVDLSDGRRLHHSLAKMLGPQNKYKVKPWVSSRGKDVYRPFMREFTLWWLDTKIKGVVL